MIDTDALNHLLDGVEGYLHPDEPAFLASLAATVPVGQVVVEIGSYRGRSTIALAYGAADGVRVYAVDPHEEHEVQGLPFGMADNQAFMANVSRAGMGHKIRVANVPSSFGKCRWWGWRNVGLLFIDGAHEYASVREDIDVWSWYLAVGGLLALHDANTWEGPTRAADELSRAQGWTEIAGCAYTRVFRKETE